MIVIAWLAVALHLGVGLVAFRRQGAHLLVPLLNLATAGCVLAYWAVRWYGYLSRGITWYFTDQLLPLYAIFVCILATVTLAGRYGGALPHRLVFGINAIILVAAAVFLTFFRITRLI